MACVKSNCLRQGSDTPYIRRITQKMSTFSKLNLVKNPSVLLIVVIGAALSSCGSYKQNIMFKTSSSSKITQEKQNAESNYVIQKNDILTLELFTNQGEKIVD